MMSAANLRMDSKHSALQLTSSLGEESADVSSNGASRPKLRKILRQAVDMISGEAHYGAATRTLSGLGSVPLWSIAKLRVLTSTILEAMIFLPSMM